MPGLSGVFFIQPSPAGISKHKIDAPANASPKIPWNSGNKQSNGETVCPVLESTNVRIPRKSHKNLSLYHHQSQATKNVSRFIVLCTHALDF